MSKNASIAMKAAEAHLEKVAATRHDEAEKILAIGGFILNVVAAALHQWHAASGAAEREGE